MPGCFSAWQRRTYSCRSPFVCLGWYDIGNSRFHVHVLIGTITAGERKHQSQKETELERGHSPEEDRSGYRSQLLGHTAAWFYVKLGNATIEWRILKWFCGRWVFAIYCSGPVPRNVFFCGDQVRGVPSPVTVDLTGKKSQSLWPHTTLVSEMSPYSDKPEANKALPRHVCREMVKHTETEGRRVWKTKFGSDKHQ